MITVKADINPVTSPPYHRRIQRRRHLPPQALFTPLPLVYLPPGTIWIRPYLDSEGEVMRFLHVHKVGDTWMPCPTYSKCQICGTLEVIPNHWAKRLKYTRREISFAYACIEKYDKPYRDIPRREPILLWGFSRFGEGISQIVKKMTDEELGTFFDPDERRPCLKIQSDIKRFDVEMALDSRVQATMRGLTEDFPPLSQCIYRDDEQPDPIQVQRFIKRIAKAYERSLACR